MSEVQADAKRIREALRCSRSGCDCKGTRGNVHCPAHEDKSPSLSVTEQDSKPLVHFHAGCSQEAVVAPFSNLAFGLRQVASDNPGAAAMRCGTHRTLVAVHERQEGPEGKIFIWQGLAQRGDGRDGLPELGCD